MIWGPFLLALALGLLVSAALYFAYLWPHVEPEDENLVDGRHPKDGEPPLTSEIGRSGEPGKIVGPDRPADGQPQVPPPSVSA